MAEQASEIKWGPDAIISFLEDAKNQINSDILKDLIKSNIPRHDHFIELYNEYTASVLAIWDKTATADRPNNKLANDFRGEIVDQKVGFSFGNSISYSFDKSKYKEKEAERITETLDDFLKTNKISYLDTQTAKYCSICGSSSRLLYFDTDKILKAMHVNPWETIFIQDSSIDLTVYALRYYEMEKVTNTEVKKFIYLEWYDSERITFFYQTESGEFALDPDQPPIPHGFDMVPLIEFRNKEERLGDYEKVRTLIDAYDYISSYNQDEIESFRNAYLVFKGHVIDEDYMKKIQKTGGIELDKDGDVKWLIKEVNDPFVENQLKRLKDNIYKFSKTVDMSDEKFSGASQSGESRKWKLKSLSDDALLKEKSFSYALNAMFEVLTSFWTKISINLSPNDLIIKYKQNVPVDLLYHAEVTGKLKGMVSEKTRLSVLPIVEDPDQEIETMAEEAEAYTKFQDELNKESTEAEPDEGKKTEQGSNE